MAKLKTLKQSLKKQVKKEEKEAKEAKEVKPTNPPRHERLKVNRLASPDQPIRVRILGPTEIFVSEDVKSLQVNLPDGKMSINRRYASVIERLKEGEIKLNLAYPSSSGSGQEKRYQISSGWLITSHNLCEILVKSCKES
ncbi:hypothetical protein DNK47_01645 [Mycoplasma wenyonii]|uniref:ATP synthase F1 complex delta/epsilon subunit N-terminal domain-containing protein n=1 Tax=Mycoplasma wenyonii TaxID=65123 RepID=A0A328PUK8_9MOLU|nr:hypothetical protein [Mycoplasma wenyonii]RAO95091.1 hypothetical protein DNK47_01645 [Mycoplasma wenyonii]